MLCRQKRRFFSKALLPEQRILSSRPAFQSKDQFLTSKEFIGHHTFSYIRLLNSNCKNI